METSLTLKSMIVYSYESPVVSLVFLHVADSLSELIQVVINNINVFFGWICSRKILELKVVHLQQISQQTTSNSPVISFANFFGFWFGLL